MKKKITSEIQRQVQKKLNSEVDHLVWWAVCDHVDALIARDMLDAAVLDQQEDVDPAVIDFLSNF